MKRLVIVFLLVNGCAHAPGPDRDVDTARHELERNQRALAALQAEAQVDCPRAGQLRDNICALADRICVLTSPTDDRCTDAGARCKAARARVEAVCPKEKR
jgi:hypothetical protein